MSHKERKDQEGSTVRYDMKNYKVIPVGRLEICRDRRDRRSCKIFPSCVKFWGNNANSLGNYRVTYALNE